MTLFRHIIVPFMTIALLGCPAARSKPLAQPEIVKLQGAYAHPASGMTFPAKIGDFERTAVLRKDSQGYHVSARYDLISLAVSVSATVDVYPSPHFDTVGLPSEMVASARENLSQQEFEFRRRETMSSPPGTILVQEGEVSLPQKDNPHMGRMAVFEYEDMFALQLQPLRSQMYLFCFAGNEWIIKYQFTYPRNADAMYEIENFMINLPWTLKQPKPPGPR